MKRTLFTLALLCTSMVGMAQVQMQSMKTNLRDVSDRVVQKKTHETMRFKDGAPAAAIDFSDAATYTMGVTPVHGIQYEPYRFVRMTDSTGADWANDYSWIARYYGMGRNLGFSLVARDMKLSVDELVNGFAMVTPLDASFKGQNYWGQWDTWVKINAPIQTVGWNIVDVHINQLGIKFNEDKYYIDWCTDGLFTPGSFDSMAFNTTLSANTDYGGEEVVSLPPRGINIPTVGQQALYIRVRFTAPATTPLPGGDFQPGGYFWFIDNIRVMDGPAYRLRVTGEGYHQGAYGMVPKGLNLEKLGWAGIVHNTGGSDITTLKPTSHIYKVTEGANQGDPMVYTEVGTPFEGANVEIPVDSAARSFIAWLAGINGQTLDYSANPTLPTSEAGLYGISVQLPVNPDGSGNPAMLDTRDTVYYIVSDSISLRDIDGETYSDLYRFGRDRNRLYGSKLNDCAFRVVHTASNMINSGSSVKTLPAGWRFCVEYTSMQENTPWYVRGVEVVPAADSCEAGVSLRASLWVPDTTEQNWWHPRFRTLMPLRDSEGEGIESDVYDVTPADLNSLPAPAEGRAYTGPTSEYNSIYFPFKKEIAIEPGLPYYVCYEMVTAGKFFVAQDPYQGGIGMGGTALIYPAQSAYLFTPNMGLPGCGKIIGSNMDNNPPMVRMIVSPNPHPKNSLSDVSTPFSTMNAYPNPANQETTISYSLRENGNVSVRLFDVVGKEIMSMPQGNQTAGIEHRVVINTENLANGVYFYTVSVNGMKETKKLVVNR